MKKLILFFAAACAFAQTVAYEPLKLKGVGLFPAGSGNIHISGNGNSGGIPYFTSAGTTVGSTATWTLNTLMKGGGAASSPVVTGITVDSSNNLSTPGSGSFGVGGSAAGFIGLTQGTAPSAGTTNVTLYAPAAVTSYTWRLPGAAATGFYLGTNTAGDVVTTQVAASGSGSVCLTVSCAMTTPNLGTPSAAVLTSATGLPIVGGTTGTLSVARGGTGATTLTGVLKGNGTSAFDVVTGSASDCVKVDGSSGSCGSGSGSVGGGISIWSAPALTITAATRYIGVGGSGIPTATEADVYVKASGPMSASNLQINFSAATGSMSSVAFTLRVAGSDSALTCTIADPATSCQDLTHTVSIAQNDLISIKYVATGTFLATPTITISTQFGTGVQDPGSNGVVVRTALNTTINRSIAATSPVTVSNGDGASGNPTLACATCGVTGTGLNQFAATTSAQLAGVISDETGSGALAFATSPTFVTPVLGVATATSINKVALTAPASGSTLTIADGKTLTVNNSPTIAGTDGTYTFQGTDTYMGRATTDTMTNKTYDAEGTGNVLTIPFQIPYKAAVCQNTTASLGFSTPTSNPAVATCATGSNTQQATADFADGANTLSVQDHFPLPTGFTGAVDLDITWRTTATTGSVVWQVATICVADAETGDPAFNTPSPVTDAAKGTTLQYNTASIAGVTTTGCAANEEFYFRFFRDPTNGSDDLAATASLISLRWTIRRAM